MPQFSSYTTPQEGAKFINPLDLDLYKQGTLYKEDLAKNNLQRISNAYNNFAGIAAFGPDAEHLQQKIAGFKNQLNQMNMSNLGDFNTISQVNGLVNTIKNDPEVNAIAQRGSFYKNEMKKEQEAEEKGLPYFSRGKQQLENYYNGKDFLLKPNVSLSQGFVGVDLTKKLNDELKDVPKEKYLGKDGFYHERPAQGRVDMIIDGITKDPRVSKQLQYQFEDKYQNANWADEGTQHLNSHIQQAQRVYNSAIQVGDLATANSAKESIDTWNKWLSDSQTYGETVKRQVYQDELSNWKKTAKEQAMFNSTEKANEFALKAQEHKDAKDMAIYNHLLDAGLIEDPSHPGNMIPGKAEIAGEIALTKAKAKNGTGADVYISDDVHNFHDNVNQRNKDNIVTDDKGVPIEAPINGSLLKKVLGLENETDKGWHQLKDATFLQHFKDFSKIDAPNGRIYSTSENGYPTVYVKGTGKDAKMIMKVQGGTQGGDYMVVNSNGVYTAAKDKEKLTKGQREALSTPEARQANLDGDYKIESSSPKSGETTYKFKGSDGKLRQISVKKDEERAFLSAHPDAKK